MKEKRWKTWLERERGTCLKALLLACLPVIACLVYCAARGQGIGEIYLPASERNDELIYYKQVEAILRYGYPQGYFGFNESHALKLSFAAWSPVLVFPWILWGLLFGWNLMSPALCNIFLLTAAMFLFGLLAKPDWKQLGITAFLFFLFLPFSWYMLCGMPETVCFSLLIVFYGAAAGFLRKKSGAFLGVMFALAALLTMMRPYLFLFLLLPAYFWIFGVNGGKKEISGGARRNPAAERGFCRSAAARWKPVLGTIVIFGATFGAYAWISHFLAAEYFRPLFDMHWLTAFFERGLAGGIRNFFGTLYYSGLEFLRYMRQGMESGLAAGSIFCCYIVVLLVLLCQSLRDLGSRRRLKAEGEEPGELAGKLVLEAHLSLSFAAMLGAVLLMCNFHVGCKHLLGFLVVGILVIAGMRTQYFKKAVLVGVVFAWFFFYHGAGFEAYEPDFWNEETARRLELFSEAVEKEMVVTGDFVPNYDNTVIWVLADELPQGMVYTGWQYLYSLPAGFGISCCGGDYVTEHFETLRSRYLCVVPGGPIEERCLQTGYEKIAGNEYAVLYRRY